MLNPDENGRVAREREFHNERFETDDSRSDQAKYYWAVSDGAEAYTRSYREYARDRDVLEYGCGDTKNFVTLASIAKDLKAIDISDTAIERLKSENNSDNVELLVMDAMKMTFADNSFDLVFGSGIIHHLDTETSAREVARVLRPGRKAIFWEPLGLNPVINAYRRMTPETRTPDEHPLVPKDFAIMGKYFKTVEIEYYGLSTLATVPFRNRKGAQRSFNIARKIDKVLFAMPGVKNIAWFALIAATK